jgi:glycosyltransferase involved in cell wall biosynthesis
MKLALIGDGDSPHLLKWARALAPRVELWAASSRGFLPGFDAVLPRSRRLALATTPRFEGGNVGLLRHAPRLAAWLRAARPDWLHAHYLTSHGTLALLARALGVRARIAGSAWGSDILETPQRSRALAWWTGRVLRACAVCTSDSQHMAARMRELGAGEVLVFPFGLEALPPAPTDKDDDLFFANRGLEAVYAPLRVLEVFAGLAADWPQACLVVAHDGSLRQALQARVQEIGLGDRVRFTGRLDPQAQARWYGRARWYLSLPRSDSVAVSVLEAMAHGCVPVLSDLPANRELVRHGEQGWIVGDGELPRAADLRRLLPRADRIAADHRAWVQAHALFEPAVERFLARLREIDAGGPAR